MEVKLSPGSSFELTIYEGEDVERKVRLFVSKHHLSATKFSKLMKLVNERLNEL